MPAKSSQRTAGLVAVITGRVGLHIKMEDDMFKATIFTASAALIAASVPSAEAGSWTTHWTGPQGGVYEGSGKCFSGACESSGTFTGPYGGVWHHSGDAHQVAPGQWAGDRTIVGPGGNTWQNSWTWRAGNN